MGVWVAAACVVYANVGQNWLKEEQENNEPPTLADYIQSILSRKAQAGESGYEYKIPLIEHLPFGG